jgi:putative hemolysin
VDPFYIERLPNTSLLRRAALGAARPALEWILNLPAYRALYQEIQRGPANIPFEVRALDALGIRPVCSPAEIALIPSQGPVVVAANHPHGIVDGLVLTSIVRRARPDVRILANHLLSRIPELADLCFFVDPFGGPAAPDRSRAGLRAAHLWVRSGGTLIVFPSGEVAHDRQPDGSYADGPWPDTVGRLALTTGAQVVPALIDGRNTPWFYAAGHIHALLRTALLAREALSARGRQPTVRLGALVSLRSRADVTSNADAATQAIREAVEKLKQRQIASLTRVGHVDEIAADIARLPLQSRLVESGTFQVFCAKAHQIPSALREIGRLREATYRAVGEGTGRDVDLDAFDDRYLHLFSWDCARQQIAGAYRIGRTDRILAAEGVTGLYTRTLFRYDYRLIARLSPALELGRSFVRAEYQRNYSALLLLWKGIGQFVTRHPQYRILFGPVSISARYSDQSHRLLMTFLLQNHLDRDLSELVQAINPKGVCLATPFSTPVPRSIDEVNRLVAQADAGGEGVPILLRQYLKLNARLLGFNVDPNFGDALDALMMVDLTTVDPAILNRYFGRQEAARFLEHHRVRRPAHAA